MAWTRRVTQSQWALLGAEPLSRDGQVCQEALCFSLVSAQLSHVHPEPSKPSRRSWRPQQLCGSAGMWVVIHQRAG